MWSASLVRSFVREEGPRWTGLTNQELLPLGSALPASLRDVTSIRYPTSLSLSLLPSLLLLLLLLLSLSLAFSFSFPLSLSLGYRSLFLSSFHSFTLFSCIIHSLHCALSLSVYVYIYNSCVQLVDRFFFFRISSAYYTCTSLFIQRDLMMAHVCVEQIDYNVHLLSNLNFPLFSCGRLKIIQYEERDYRTVLYTCNGFSRTLWIFVQTRSLSLREKQKQHSLLCARARLNRQKSRP